MIDNEFKLKKERSLGDMITDSFTFVRVYMPEIKDVFSKFILPALVVVLISSAFVEYMRQSITGSLLDDSNAFDLLSGGVITSIAFLISVLAQFAFYIVSYIVIFSLMRQKASNETFLVDSVAKDLKENFLHLAGILFVGIVMVIIAAIFLVIPAIYLIVPVSILPAIAILGKKNFSETFTTAFQLIKNNWWITFVTLIIFGLIISLGSIIFQVPLFIYYLIKFIFGYVDGMDESGILFSEDTDWILLILTIIGNFGGFLFNLLSVILTGLIYYNLDEFHNKTGTYEDIESIGS